MGHIIPVIRAQNRKGLDISSRRRRGLAIHNRWHHAEIQTKLVETHPATNDVMRCAGQIVIRINKTTHALHRRGARMGKGHIILTGEDHFYRHFHFHGGNRTQNQRFHFSALAKAATNQMGVEYDILRIKPGIVGNEHGRQRGILVTAIKMQLAITEMRKGTHGFHWHMRDHGGFIEPLVALFCGGFCAARITDAQHFMFACPVAQHVARFCNDILAAKRTGAFDIPFDLNDLCGPHRSRKTLGNDQRGVRYDTGYKPGFGKIDWQSCQIAADIFGIIVIN